MWHWVIAVAGTVLRGNATRATAALPSWPRILPPGAPSTTGIRLAANALFPTKVEEMLTP